MLKKGRVLKKMQRREGAKRESSKNCGNQAENEVVRRLLVPASLLWIRSAKKQESIK